MLNDPPETDDLARQGLALLKEARDSDALPVYQELTRRRPGHSAHWVNLGTLLRRLHRHDEALAAYIQAAALGEDSPSFLYNVGLLHQDRGDFDSARRVLADAARRAPGDSEILLQYAQCCYESLHIEAATAALAGWRELQGLTSEQLATLALLLLNLGETQAAGEAAARAAADPGPSARALLRLAQVQERSNRVGDAHDILRRLESLPGATALGEDLRLLEAQIALRERRHEQAIPQFQALVAGCTEPDRRHLYLFPLARALDAVRRHEEAWRCLVDAHEAQLLHLARTNPDAAGMREPPLLITRHGCDRADIAGWDESDAPPAGASPVFIVAFPRSGTTLLEQMLDAHPGLVTMDEQPFLQQAIDRITDLGIDYPAGLARLTAGQLAGVREHYWSLARRKVRLSPGQRLIDKNPLNLLRLPAIRRLFPHARILLAIRHPCDVVLSCFMQHFRSPEFAVLCRDLPTLARGYRRSFDFWYGQLPLLQPAVREVRYESFVADFSTQAADIMAFLGLDLVPAQLQPAAHALAKGFISTPSYAQVIEPVHGRAVGRSAPYATWFGEALGPLQPYLERWGYAAGGA
ncbi:MAG: sulfotransferase, partial [Gammaproteobacteria bacterium]|nr:sulfotransferase [Gammaproteobacteria bacterium]